MPIKYVLKYNELSLGDIIIDREESSESHKIRRITKSDYSHARLYVGGAVMEANGLGVQSVNPQRIVYDSPDDVKVLRCINANSEELENACIYARSEFAKEYGIKKLDNTQFCFRLVAEAFQYAGIEIIPDPKRCTANDFLSSDKLAIVDDVIRIANERDLEIAYSEGIIRDEGHYNQQSLAAADMFSKIRNYVASHGINADTIQDDGALFLFLIEHPDLDKGIAAILRESPYFALWKTYKEMNPWEFDVVLLKEHFGVYSKEAASQILDSCDGEEPRVWAKMFCIVSNLLKQYHFESAKVYICLYNNLIIMNRERRAIAEAVISGK